VNISTVPNNKIIDINPAECGKKTFVVDLDFQGNASQYLINDQIQAVRDVRKTVYDYFKTMIDTVSSFGFIPFFIQIGR